MRMKKEIRRYRGKLGEITVTEYSEGGSTEYRVMHHGITECRQWFADWQKSEAIAYAQFLASKY